MSFSTLTNNESIKCEMMIGSNTKYIISTSGRISSLKRYKRLLQDILKIDVAYIPISSSDPNDSSIDPKKYAYSLRGLNCIGGAISRDIKHSIIPYLDSLDSTAESIQAVNTVIVFDDKLVGYNTDAMGFKQAIINGLQKSNICVQNAICYGYGGVAAVVVSVLRSLGIQTYITGRRMDVAKQRADELNASVWSESIECQLFINAAPVTDKPLDQADNFLNAIKTCSIVFDHEMPGAFLRDYCDGHNVFHISGLDMYYPQMYSQWKLFLKNYISEDADIANLVAEAEKRV